MLDLVPARRVPRVGGGAGAGLRQVPPGRPVQAVDKETGLPVWAVSVLDADPDARKDGKTVTVKIAAPHQPVPPEAPAGLPFRPVEFEGLTVTPYVDEQARAGSAYSLRATGMRAPQAGVQGPGHGRTRGRPACTPRAEGSCGGNRAPLLISRHPSTPAAGTHSSRKDTEPR